MSDMLTKVGIALVGFAILVMVMGGGYGGQSPAFVGLGIIVLLMGGVLMLLSGTPSSRQYDAEANTDDGNQEPTISASALRNFQ